MPPKREAPKKVESDAKGFYERLFNDIPATEKGGVLRNSDGAYLSRVEIFNNFKSALEQSGYTRGVASHLLEHFITPRLNTVSELARQKKNEPDNAELADALIAAQEQLVTEMRAMMEYSSNYGIDKEAQGTPRHEIRINEEEMLGLLQDIDNVPDPLYVNGQLPTPQALGVACKYIYDLLYKDEGSDDEAARRTRVILKEKCLNQLVREFEEAERERDFSVKKTKVATAVARMTQFMRDILTTEGVQKYIDGIAEGVLAEDAVQFPSITQRPSYNALDTTSPEKKWQNFQSFYKTYTESYSAEHIARLVREFDTGGASFFRDEAGIKDITHIYYDLVVVFKQKGITEEEVGTTFAPFIKDLVGQMIAFKNEMNAEYKKGFGRKQDRINKLKQELGEKRKTFLAKAQNQVTNADLLRYVGVSQAIDMDAVLKGEVTTETVVESSTIDFTCEDFADKDKRIESYEAFMTVLDEVLNPLRNQENANALGQNDTFIATRDLYEAKLNSLRKLVEEGGENIQVQITSLAQEVTELHTSLVAFYEQYQPEDQLAEGGNDTL